MDEIWLGRAAAVVMVCMALLLSALIKRRTEWLLNVVMRAILGTLAMYLLNSRLAKAGILLPIGINPATVLTSGILGFPGFLALYGIALYKFL
jgi:inhibitor of the pro-sigma K processing machinery